MKALYRTVSAILAIAAGLVIAALITVVVDDREINVVWFVVFAAGAVLAAATALLLWGRTLRK